MTETKYVLVEYKEERGPSITFGGKGRGQTRGFVILHNGATTFWRVAYVEGLKHNLLSISELCDKDYIVLFTKRNCKVKDKSGNIVLTGDRMFVVYVININSPNTENVCFMSKASSDIN